ncbi:MAG: TIGR01777 family oxidoreductase [Acidimicrobiia bacterium]|nr:MAG: TIGR01777 family oxidoreductase [Acidimicrobiia bacterium]
MQLVVAGSSGLIGEALVRSLRSDGHGVRRLVRPETAADGVSWDPRRGHLPTDALSGVDAVVNLAGRSIGERRWSDAEKGALWASRVDSTRLLAESVAQMGSPPVLLNASAVGYYGDGGDAVLDETAAAGDGFLARLCAAWEEATTPAAAAGGRVVHLRSGIVLSTRGGALGRLLAPFGPRWLSPYRWGLGGVVGRGRQWWSWISLQDEVAAIRHLLESDLSGPVNLVAQEPVTHREFVKALGRVLRRPTVVPIPSFVLRMILGSELAEALVLEGQRVVPARLEADGFRWHQPDLEQALAAALAG